MDGVEIRWAYSSMQGKDQSGSPSIHTNAELVCMVGTVDF